MTEFGRYLKQCPPALKDKTRTLSLLKDALKNDLPKFRVLQAAYELGILEAIQRSNPISTDDRLKITTGLVSQYAMLENAAKSAQDRINFAGFYSHGHSASMGKTIGNRML